VWRLCWDAEPSSSDAACAAVEGVGRAAPEEPALGTLKLRDLVPVRGTAQAYARDGRVAPGDRARTRVVVDRLWGAVAEVPVDAALIRHAGDLADQHGLRGYDAVHLAALLSLDGPGDARFACWDDELAAAVRGLGYAVVGASA
jgi:predicted nucleic acid-binding protein